MSQPANPIQPIQVITLLVIVIGVAFAASWGIRNLNNEPPSVSVQQSPAEDTCALPVEKSTVPLVKSSEVQSQGSPLHASVIFPRVPLAIAPDKLEKECEQFVERLVQQLPDDPLALNLAAMYYSKMQQTTRADELWKKCVQSAPKDPLIYHNWSTNAIHRGDSQQALNILDQAKIVGIEDDQLLYQRCIALSNLGQDAEVETILTTSVANDQMNGLLWLQLGLSQLKLGKYKLAGESLLQAKS